MEIDFTSHFLGSLPHGAGVVVGDEGDLDDARALLPSDAPRKVVRAASNTAVKVELYI